MTTQQINEAIKTLPDANQVSDGYHTFGELYDHRIALYISFCDLLSMSHFGPQTFFIWRSTAHSDGSVWDGWFILGIDIKKDEQITYHLPIKLWDDCGFAEILEKAPEWDGHTSADVLDRIRSFNRFNGDSQEIDED